MDLDLMWRVEKTEMNEMGLQLHLRISLFSQTSLGNNPDFFSDQTWINNFQMNQSIEIDWWTNVYIWYIYVLAIKCIKF